MERPDTRLRQAVLSFAQTTAFRWIPFRQGRAEDRPGAPGARCRVGAGSLTGDCHRGGPGAPERVDRCQRRERPGGLVRLPPRRAAGGLMGAEFVVRAGQVACSCSFMQDPT